MVLISWQATTAQPGNSAEEYEVRRQALIESSLANPSNENLLIQAYTDALLDINRIEEIVNSLEGDQNPDFRMTYLLRILYLTDGEYDDLILPFIAEIPLWMNEGDITRIYTSENHMIMYLGIAHLLNQKYGWEINPNTEELIRTWLKLKIDYGFYEFFSPTYAPFTFAALLNIYDFTEDEEIREMARQVTDLLISEFLLLTNDRGIYFPIAGRSYPGEFASPMQKHLPLIYLITGLGETPIYPQKVGAFLVTSNYDVTSALNMWEPNIATNFSFGHPITDFPNILGHLNKEDRVMFQWSAGAYFHPAVAAETIWYLDFYKYWAGFGLPDLSFLPNSIGTPLAQIGAAWSRSSYLGNVNGEIFKNGPVTLSSAENYWPGRRGYQQYPIMANVGEVAVYTASGPVIPFNERESLQSNSHLPNIIQDENVALILYRPKIDFVFLGGIIDLDVSLHMPLEDFDEVRRFNKWVIGKDGDGYIAVLKPCNNVVNGLEACPTNLVSLWAIVVGSEEMYGSFNEFEQAIRNATFREGWIYNDEKRDWDFTGSLQLDGREIKGSISSVEDDSELLEDFTASTLHAYPNPANQLTHIDLSTFEDQQISVTAINSVGQEVFSSNGNAKEMETLDVSEWPVGWYSISVKGNIDQKSFFLTVGR